MKVKNLPKHLQEVIEVSKFIKLYLLDTHETKDPAEITFLFRDPLNNESQVILSSKGSKCSCLPGNK